MKKAKVTEIFSSIQGEGIYAGVKQIFLRFYGCNLSCQFCDTRPLRYQEYSATQLLGEILNVKEEYHSISITGGEPLLQKDFLKELLPVLKTAGRKIYLETNATLPDELGQILDFIDFISMDFKLPSSTGLMDFWHEHKIFLKKAVAKEVFVKAVITADTAMDDIERMRDIIAEVAPGIVLVLQPVTPINSVKGAPVENLHHFQKICLNKLKTVRIVPQLHKIVGVK